ncbi:hypothetical protein B566_EDAN006723 [Ephemera danica]|nr:hypothetical protein B566_EDAN006723 [Ephemera danica]
MKLTVKMNALSIVCLVLALVGSTLGAVPSKRSTDETTLPSLSDMVTEAERHLHDFTTAFQNLLNPETRDETLTRISENVTNHSQAFATRVQDLVNNLNEAIKNGQPNEALQQAADRLNNTVRQLVGEKTAGEAEQAGNELSESLRNAVQTVVEEAGKISRSVDEGTASTRDELAVATRSAVREALDFAEMMRLQFEQALSNATPAS